MPNATDSRQESDSLGTINVPHSALWGAQTQRALANFDIGHQKFPSEFIRSFALVKKAAALSNRDLGTLPDHLCHVICQACDEIIAGQHDQQFPLVVWQTGSGTQTNMNFNEVIANRANELMGAMRGAKHPVHPNDHVNLSQSSNDVFPTVMHVSVLSLLQQRLLPALNVLHDALAKKALEFHSLIKIGRTHLMDAAPITLGQEFSGYVSQIDYARTQISAMQLSLKMLALGGSAVGTGLNTPETWAPDVARKISQLTDIDFCSAPNKFMASSAHDALVDLHGRLRLLATALFKIANDLRLLGSGPRCGLGELLLPANEPGSSIMPGKVNPTQTEALTMIAAQVIGNDTTIGFAGSQGHLELNVFKPVIIHNLLESINLLSDGMRSFTKNCIEGLQANKQQLARNVDRSLMLVTALSPVIGYDKAATAAKLALEKNLSIKTAIMELKFLPENEIDQLIDPRLMLSPGNQTEKTSN